MNIELSPKKVLITLLAIIFTLLLANMVGIISSLYFGHERLYGFVKLFNFNKEQNIPTLYSSLSLMIASVLLAFIASKHKILNQSYVPWLGLAFIFLFLSIDEILELHENLTTPVRNSFNTSGLLYYAWVIPYGISVLIFTISYLNFLKQLPQKIMILFLISGGMFVTGAIGFELFGGRHDQLYGIDNLGYSLLYTGEELFEKLGIAVFIYTLLLYITSQFTHLKIIVTK